MSIPNHHGRKKKVVRMKVNWFGLNKFLLLIVSTNFGFNPYTIKNLVFGV